MTATNRHRQLTERDQIWEDGGLTRQGNTLNGTTVHCRAPFALLSRPRYNLEMLEENLEKTYTEFVVVFFLA